MNEEQKWDAAGKQSASEIGWDDEPCWDGFSFEIEGQEFYAELHELYGPGRGLVKVTDGNQGCRLYDEDGCEEEVLS